jgi:hypothetical protein
MKQTLACLIIDDPLLIPRYGNLDYEKLLAEMQEHNFFTEIAFIPWNYRRSDPGTIKLFKDNPDRYTICVHGCDHTGNEFGIDDPEELDILVHTAIWRMDRHEALTGLPYDPVIVFPQGKFSAPAIKALKDAGFQAAFNSHIGAVGNILSETRRPASTYYHDFPVFLRRYPKDSEKFREDIKNGRPILIVQHPGDFRNGYQGIADLVDRINDLAEIKWTSLSNIAEHYGYKRNGTVGIKPSFDLPRNIKTGIRRLLCEARDYLR